MRRKMIIEEKEIVGNTSLPLSKIITVRLLLSDFFMEEECSWIKFEESDKVLQKLPVRIPVFVISPAIA